MSQSMFMYDDVNLALEPAGAYAYAGYVDGRFENFQELEALFPGAHFLSIAVSASDDAACLDDEPGDATNAEVFAWFQAQVARGQYRPCVYTSADNLTAMETTMAANGFARESYRMWSAHYTNVAHFCGPDTCHFGISQADATQYTDDALGRSLDESIIADDFFPVPTPPPPPPGKATQPTRVVATAKFTNATISWSGAADVSEGYYVDLLDGVTNVTLDHVWLDISNRSGIYKFGQLQENHAYKLGIYARPGVTGSHSQWITVTTE